MKYLLIDDLGYDGFSVIEYPDYKLFKEDLDKSIKLKTFYKAYEVKEIEIKRGD